MVDLTNEIQSGPLNVGLHFNIPLWHCMKPVQVQIDGPALPPQASGCQFPAIHSKQRTKDKKKKNSKKGEGTRSSVSSRPREGALSHFF